MTATSISSLNSLMWLCLSKEKEIGCETTEFDKD